jgi:hypothetical protein
MTFEPQNSHNRLYHFWRFSSLRRSVTCAASDQLYFESKDTGMELYNPDQGTAATA